MRESKPRKAPRGRGARRRLALGLLLVAGCRGDDGEPERSAEAGDGGMMQTSGPPDEGTSTGQVDEPGGGPTDQCERAPEVGAGTHRGSLRGNATALGGACGQGGPDAFVRVEVPRRSDVSLRGLGVAFAPRVGVLPNECVEEWDTRTMLCGDQGVETWLLDVAAGSSVLVSIGIDPEDPALGLPPPTVGPDPLAFALEVELRNVLDEGDPCEPLERGRCGTGTVCMAPPPDDDGAIGPSLCTAIEGDTCESAIDLELMAGLTMLRIDPASPHTDAHHHSCGGARRRERVLRLAMPGVGPHALEVRGDRPGLGFALRAPGCLPSDELACATDDLEPARVTAEIPSASVLLFVELPPEEIEDEDGTTTGDEPGEEAPIFIEVEVLEAPPAE